MNQTWLLVALSIYAATLVLGVLRPAPEPAPARGHPGGRRRPGLARAGEAPALRQLCDGGARRDDRVPDEHEAAAVVTAAPARDAAAVDPDRGDREPRLQGQPVRDGRRRAAPARARHHGRRRAAAGRPRPRQHLHRHDGGRREVAARRPGAPGGPARTRRSSSPAARSRSGARRSPPRTRRPGSSTTGRRTPCSPSSTICSGRAGATVPPPRPPASGAPCRRSRASTRSPRRSTASPTAGRRSSGPAPSSRSRTAARSSAPTASSRPPAARSGVSALRSSSPTSARAIAAGHREIVLTGINVGTYDGGWSERGFRGSHVRSALTLGRPRPADPRRDRGRADPDLLDRAAACRRRAAPRLGRRRAADPAARPPAAPVGR